MRIIWRLAILMIMGQMIPLRIIAFSILFHFTPCYDKIIRHDRNIRHHTAIYYDRTIRHRIAICYDRTVPHRIAIYYDRTIRHGIAIYYDRTIRHILMIEI